MASTNDRPPSWSPHNASAFQLADVVEHYHLRAPYPSALFPFLRDLAVPPRGAVIELGCGTGEITRALASHAERIDAIDISRQMIERARSMPGGDHPAIRWIEGRSEDAPLNGPYALAVAGASLHWMDWDITLPRVARNMSPGAVLAIVVSTGPPPWGDELHKLVSQYSAIQNWENADLIAMLEQRQLFKRVGEKTIAAEPYQRTVEQYIDGLHATSGLARDRIGIEQASAFDAAIRALVAPHVINGALEHSASAEVTWGRPLSP